MPKFRPFTEQEKQFILDNFEAMTLRQMAHALGRSEGGVKTWIRKLGLRRNMRFEWTPERVEIFERLYPNHSAQEIAEVLNTTKQVIHAKSRHSSLRKTPEYLAKLNKELGKNLQKNGYGTRFEKGHKPWCAGKKIGSHPNSVKTQFKKGQKPLNICKVGDIRKPSGYWKIKVAEPNKWEFLHIQNWKKAHGEIPKGFCIVFKDGNADNCVLENLACVSRAELFSSRNIHTFPPEIQDAYRAIGRLTRTINRKEKKSNAEKQTA